MNVTREFVARQLSKYLSHGLTLAELVDWAEDAMQEGDFDERDLDVVRDTVARPGLADVRAFGLTWEDCQDILGRLGYRAHVEVTAAPSV